MILDIKTLMFIYLLITILNLGTMYFLWKEYKDRYPGINYWLADMAFQVAGILLIVLRGLIPLFISAAIGNLLTVTGLYFVLIGYRKFIGKESNNIYNNIFISLYFIILSYYTIISENLKIREVFICLILIILSSQLFYETRFRVQKELKKVSKILGVTMLGYLFSSIFRILYNLTFSLNTNDFFNAGSMDAITMIIYMLLNIGAIISLILILTERLKIDISFQEEKYQKSFYLAPFAIVLSRFSDGKLYEINKGFEEITGYIRDDLSDKTSLDLHLWANNEDRNKMMQTLQTLNTIKNEEFMFRKKSGETFIGLLSSEIIDINNEKCLITTVRDITEQKMNYEKLREAKETAEYLMKSKEELLLTISHDLRTPLNGIMGMSELAGITDDQNKKNEYLSIITKSAEHLNSLISGILETAQNKEDEKFNIDNLYHEIQNTFEKKLSDKNLTLYLLKAPNLPDVMKGNFTKLRQIIFNLIENAVKYTKNGGVLVNTHLKDFNSSKALVEFEISDTGIGIEEKKLNNIFDLYYRENNNDNINSESYGIGLYNVKNIVEALGGKIHVKSKTDSGSSFTFFLEFDIETKCSASFSYDSNFESIVISDEIIDEMYLVRLMSNFSVKFHKYNSFRDYLIDEKSIKNHKVVFVSDKLSVNSSEILSESSDVFIFGRKNNEIHTSEKIDFYLDASDAESFILKSLKIEIEKIDTYNNEKSNLHKTYNIKALIIEDNELNTIILKEMLNILGVKSDTAQTVDDAVILVKNNNYDIIFSDFFLEKLNAVDFISRAGNFIQENTIKIIITATESEKLKNHALVNGFDLCIGKPYTLNDIYEILEKYFSGNFYSIKKSETIEKNNNKYYNIFITQLENEIVQINFYLKNKDSDSIKRSAHKLKGSADLLGETKISSYLKDLTEKASVSNFECIPKILSDITEDINRIRRDLIENSNS